MANYSTPGYMRDYQREWMRARRAEFFAGKTCVSCGSGESLELDHVDPAEKVSHRIWSWSRDRQAAEIAKCQVLCTDCHKTKTFSERRSYRGASNPAAVWSDDDVRTIHEMRQQGMTYQEIGDAWGVSKSAIRNAYVKRLPMLDMAASTIGD